MVDMALIGGLSNSLNVALNITKAMFSIRDQAIIQEKVAELTGVIVSAHQAQSALIERVRELEADLVRMENWETEKQRYELKQVSSLGTFAYALKEGTAGSEPPYRICAACYDRGKKSVLQATADLQSRHRVHACPECKTTIMVGV
jgi:hypothetical protein